MSAFTPHLSRAVSGAPLAPAEMRAAMDALFAGEASDVEIAGFLSALRARGETVAEIAAAAQAMRDHAVKVEAPKDVIDTCGTGGDGAGTYNISTAAALIAAGCGVRVAKHGNKAASSKSGSSEVLESLGVKLDIAPERIAACIEEANVGFMFAALHHPAMKHVAPVRKALGVRTLFNALGPLSNPAGATRQVMGVFDRALVRPIAEVMPHLGVTRAWVVHGSDGLDELTTTGPSHVASLEDGEVTEFEVTPEEAGLARAKPEDLAGGDPSENAAALWRLLEGEKSAYRDISVLNAAAALIVAGKADALDAAARLAEKSIDTGAAKAALENLVACSNRRK
ncbi:anthranilate phosphoribosyltransferase [Hyphococcus luteus]|uniref:Anthranilate phosphoribosyltransferase n=1 Tax=Hyphococcus luteus TaxID=2058213 RepID=A0A2S7JYL4_9PROT|nr:anthranilate phosphoribosyltransferase [Marinicaulis flavus]PQA85341.1 anthranilate phosphoribosyltransferase [Marinicaulis flavus]